MTHRTVALVSRLSITRHLNFFSRQENAGHKGINAKQSSEFVITSDFFDLKNNRSMPGINNSFI